MGFVFGAAIMLGVAGAVTGSRVESLILAGCLVGLSLMIGSARRRYVAVALLGLAVGFGATSLRSEGVQSRSGPSATPDELVGVIVSDPRLATINHSARISWPTDDGLKDEALVLFSGTRDVGRGDLVAVRGEWSGSIDGLYFADRITVIEDAGAVEGVRRNLRATATNRVLDRVPGSNGSLALGLIIGDDSGLTGEERDALRASGLSHITAVSGSNVAMVIVAIAFFLQAFGRVGWFWFAAQFAGVVFYVWIIGADPPIVRAAIMGSLILVAGVIGRPTHLFTLLFLAGGAMTLADPEVLRSLSFQLSFLSMIGLGVAGEIISRSAGRRRKVVGALLSPAAAAIATAPLLAARFGTLSLGTLPANVIVAPIIVPATGLAALAAIIPDGFVTGHLVGACLWLSAGAILFVSSAISDTPYALLEFSPLTNSQTIACYLMVGLLLLPALPEGRLAGYRLRVWAVRAPGLAVASLLTGGLMLGTLSFIVD